MIFIIILLCIFSFRAFAKDMSVGFMIYGDPIPEEALYVFDWLVVDPDSEHTKKVMTTFYLKNRKAKLIAYVSVGEAEPYREYYKEIPKEWILGKNEVWNSYVVDIRKEEYIKFLLDRVFPRLEAFDGFFLDTLDSHQLFLKNPQDLQKARENLTKLVKSIRNKYPDKLILLNRGFEIMEDVKGYADAIVAESLFYGISYDKKKIYKKMKPEDTEWLLSKLKTAKELGYKVIVIDYVDPKNKKLQIEVAKQIYELGFIPYVSDKYLRTLGISTYKLKPRRILMLYNSKLYKDPSFTVVNRLIQPWLEYIGYVPVIMEVKQALSDDRLNYHMADIYAGIVVDVATYDEGEKLFKWLVDKRKEGLKIFFLNTFGFPEESRFLNAFALRKVGALRAGQRYEIVESSFEFFEAKPLLENIPMIVPERANYYIKVKAGNKIFYPLAITDWGGYALTGSFISVSDEFRLFVVEPVKFLSRIFEPMPLIPDTTTENGRRLLIVHIDGDAFFGNADFNPSRNVAEVIRDEIIKRYPIPHTVSIIEGEIAPYGLYPEKSERLETIARSIFALDNVEIASHTFSHPFIWQELESYEVEGGEINPNVQYNLPIKGYNFDLRREIFGSIEYINTRLAPEGKRVKVFLWSGDTNPSERAIRMTYEAGVYNVNGGYTWINRKEPFWMYIGPMGVNKGEYFQIYAPIMNENIYTRLWTDYYGFVRVIDTFELTERPYRLKPLNIYYHMYSGQKIASLEALKRVYEWALAQSPNPIYLSEYAQKVLEYRNFALLEDIRDNSMLLRGGGTLRTLRVDFLTHIDTDRSKGVVGYRHINNSTYINLDSSGEYKIVFSEEKPRFNLIEANGRVLNFQKGEKGYILQLQANVPLEFTIESQCQLRFEPKPENINVKAQITTVRYKENKNARIEAYCKK